MKIDAPAGQAPLSEPGHRVAKNHPILVCYVYWVSPDRQNEGGYAQSEMEFSALSE